MMEDIQKQTEGNRLRWFGYAKRMEEHRIPKTLLQMKITEKTPRGRPRTQWLEQDNRNRKKRTIPGEGRINAGINRL
jgi:hypothetical protein